MTKAVMGAALFACWLAGAYGFVPQPPATSVFLDFAIDNVVALMEPFENAPSLTLFEAGQYYALGDADGDLFAASAQPSLPPWPVVNAQLCAQWRENSDAAWGQYLLGASDYEAGLASGYDEAAEAIQIGWSPRPWAAAEVVFHVEHSCPWHGLVAQPWACRSRAARPPEPPGSPPGAPRSSR